MTNINKIMKGFKFFLIIPVFLLGCKDSAEEKNSASSRDPITSLTPGQSNSSKNTVDRSAGAEGSEDINDLTWHYKFGDDGNGNVQQVEIALSDSQAKEVEGELVIPGEINGAIVEVIGEGAFMGADQLTSVVLPVTTTRIESGAFYNSTNLEKVTIPDGVTHIGDGAFYNCTALTSITIPASVKSIGMRAFADCGMLESITFLGEPPRLLREESQFHNTRAWIYYNPDFEGWHEKFGDRPTRPIDTP